MVANVLSWLWKQIMGPEEIRGSRTAPVLRVVALPAIVAALYFSVQPWIGHSFEYVQKENKANWGRVAKAMTGEIGPDDVVITTSPMEARYYGFRNHMYEFNNQHIIEYSKKSPDAEFGLIDSNSGVSMIAHLKQLKKCLAKNSGRDIWFLMNRYEFNEESAVPLGIKHFMIDAAEWYSLDHAAGKLIRVDQPKPREFAIGLVKMEKSKTNSNIKNQRSK